jgi:hypothetical protein
MTEYKLILVSGDTQTEYTEAASFKFVKERYTPYTYFSGVFRGNCVPEEITEVIFYCGGKKIHDGIADSIICERRDGGEFVTVKSYGFTMLLGQNQSEPGIISSPDLGTLIKRNLPILRLGYQSDTKAVNYIYINENTTVWDSICVYALKAYGTYPYIYNTNVIRCERMGSNLFTYDTAEIVSARRGQKLTNLISHGFTQDVDGNWTYTKTNDFAVNHNITKQKYYARDKEWYYDLNDELNFRLNNADRGRVYTEFCRIGYGKEDLLDHATLSLSGFELSDSEIDRIEINGSRKGVFTTLSCYSDSYCNN